MLGRRWLLVDPISLLIVVDFVELLSYLSDATFHVRDYGLAYNARSMFEMFELELVSCRGKTTNFLCFFPGKCQQIVSFFMGFREDNS